MATQVTLNSGSVDSAGSLALKTNGTTTAVTIDTSQNVGIGTTSPSTFTGYTTVSVNNAVNGGIYNILVNGTETARLQGYSGIFNVAAKGASTVLTFETNGAERARIDSSGNLCLNSTGYNSGKIVREDNTDARVRSMIVNNSNAGSSSRCGYIVNASGNSWAMEMGSVAANSNALNWTVDVFGSPAVKMSLTTGGAAYNSTGTWGTISDARLKENVADATPKLDSLMQLRVVNYNLKSDPDVKMLGFVAQEVEQVFPGLVDSDGEMSEDGDRYKSVKTTVLIPMLIKAIQEQQALITTLTDRITALESKA